MSDRRRRFSIAGKLALLGGAPIALSIAAAVLLTQWLAPVTAGLAAFALALPLWLWLVGRATGPVVALFRALAGTASSYRDSDFAFSLRWDRDDELGDLVAAHNQLGDTLREHRVGLVQRELLLDTMVQHTPVAMLLLDAGRRVAYGNLAARRLLHGGQRLEGRRLDDVLHGAPAALGEALERGGDGLFGVGAGDPDDEEVFHLTRRGFRLNGRPHELILLRHVTAELRRQEVKTWKKVIRVISHELNNSLAPVASLAHSGAELVRRGQHDRLGSVFQTIEERARHLDGFIRGYARFAKLPTPQPAPVAWRVFLDGLRGQCEFRVAPPPEDWIARIDRAQLEQALLNLVKNAHESGSAPDEVEVRLERLPGWYRLAVVDRGSGMPEATLTSALAPFYSTKRSGTGLGLALAREIAEAHGGRIALANRAGGGLEVALTLPE